MGALGSASGWTPGREESGEDISSGVRGGGGGLVSRGVCVARVVSVAWETPDIHMCLLYLFGSLMGIGIARGLVCWYRRLEMDVLLRVEVVSR